MILMLVNYISDKQKFKQITKIHKQFGHASKENIKKLLTNANLMSNDLKQIIDKVTESSKHVKNFENHLQNQLLHIYKIRFF